jgi:sugar lactone lactonase YvrE
MIMLMLVPAIVLGINGCATQPKIKKTEVGQGIVWPKPPERARVKLIASYRGSFDVDEGSRMLRMIGEERTARLNRPHGVVADSEGNIYVSDIGYRILTVYKFDVVRKKFDVIGKGMGTRVRLPLGLGIDNERRLLFVADSGSKGVMVFDKDSFGFKFAIGQDQGTFRRPVSVAVDSKRQRVYVSDTRLHVVKAFTYDSQLLFTIGKGKRASGKDGFNVPAQVALDREGNLYVADMFNRFIKVFSPEGKFIKKIGLGVGMSIGNFSKVVGVAVDSEGHIYGLDTDFGNFQLFDQQNRLLLSVAERGTGDERLMSPSNIYIDGRDRIYVTDTLNARIQVYQYLGEGSGK